jgi:LuxR family maltose regulon positive regulatory protein
MKEEKGNFHPSSLILPPLKVAWVSLDEGDNDPVRFWIYVIAALDTVQSGLGAGALPLLHSPQPSPLEVVLTLLLNDLAILTQDLVLVLDVYHLIENAEIHTSLIFFWTACRSRSG